MGLSEYQKKRNFSSTNEPQGKKKLQTKNNFVIQYHQARTTHFDFRLEHNGVLLSWAVPKGLSTDPKDKHLAVMVEDHPVDYIDFEGIIPKGNYGAGTVEIYDRGNFIAIEDFDEGLKKGHLKFLLNGEKLKGIWSLVKISAKNWLIIKSDDDFAKSDNPKKSKLPFTKCSPQLATLANKIPKGENWIFEIKYDGYRAFAFAQNGNVNLLSRNGIDFSKKFSKITKEIKKIQRDNFVLDGEIVSFDKNGRSDFSLLQENLKKGKQDFYFVIFDLLALDGQDLRKQELLERKNKLQRLIYDISPLLIYSAHVDKGEESFKFAKENNLEGIIAKIATSQYSGRRTEDWLKIKCYLRQEFVIAGYTTSSKNQLLSSILVGYYNENKLIYAGKVGTGFDDNEKLSLCKLFEKIKSKTCPFLQSIKEKDANWIKPKYVAEIQFAEFTRDNILRQASFLGLREDKNAKDVKLEKSQ